MAASASASRSWGTTSYCPKSYGTAGTDLGSKIAVDASGNVYVVGLLAGALDFGGGTLPVQGSTDAFILELTALGAHRWSKTLGGIGGDRADGVVVGASGDVFVAGSSSGDVDFGAGPVPAKGSSDLFLAGYSSGGAYRWAVLLGGTGSIATAQGLARDSKDNLSVSGDFTKTADLGAGPVTSKGLSDVVLASFGASGTHRWSRTLGGSGQDNSQAVAVDAAGNVYVTGAFESTMDAGGKPLVSAGAADAFVASYTGAGAHRWSLGLGGSTSDGGVGIAVGPSGTVWVTGRFTGSAQFGGSQLTSLGSWEIFVVQLKP